MTAHYKEKIPNMSYKQMDARKLQFEDGSFDCVFDKACFDSVLSGDNSTPNSRDMLSEIHRVLAPNGVYICVTYGVPASRLNYFDNKLFDWAGNVTVCKAAKPYVNTGAVIAEGDKNENENFHFIYIMQKQGAPVVR